MNHTSLAEMLAVIGFMIFSRSQRRQELGSRYWFDCQCIACVKNWPVLQNLTKNPQIDLRIANQFVERSKVKEAIAAVQPYLEAGEDNSTPSEEYIRAVDLLRRCINNQGSVIFIKQ